jgi:hypothetical protein
MAMRTNANGTVSTLKFSGAADARWPEAASDVALNDMAATI